MSNVDDLVTLARSTENAFNAKYHSGHPSYGLTNIRGIRLLLYRIVQDIENRELSNGDWHIPSDKTKIMQALTSLKTTIEDATNDLTTEKVQRMAINLLAIQKLINKELNWRATPAFDDAVAVPTNGGRKKTVRRKIKSKYYKKNRGKYSKKYKDKKIR